MAKYEATFVNYFPMPGAWKTKTKVYEFDKDSTKKERLNYTIKDMEKMFGDDLITIDKIELIKE